MNTLTQSEIFFFISSVGFVILWALVAILLYYVIKTVRTFRRITEKVEGDINKMGDTTREMLEDMKGSWIWGFLTRKKRSIKKNN